MARIKFGGVEYPIVRDYTFNEARTVKRLTGKTLDEFDQQFVRDPSDGDCLFAMFLIAVQRVKPHITEQEIGVVKLDDIELVFDPPAKNGDAPPPEADADVGT